MSIHVAIVEDETSMRESLAEFIHGTPGFACVAACASAEEALEVIPSSTAEVVLVDMNLPNKSGVDFVREFYDLCPRTLTIMLTVEEDSQRVLESLKVGATGYLVKNVAPEEILEAISEVHRGGAPMSSHVARMVVTTFSQPAANLAAETALTAREDEILRFLARGDRSREIADRLGISRGTVNTHIRNVYEKLHVRSRAGAIARYLRRS